MKRILFLALIMLLTLAGCCSKSPETKIAKQYLKEQGYKVLSHDGSSEPLILTKEELGNYVE